MNGERRIRGAFCEKVINPRKTFEPESFRWKQSGRAWLLIGCPRGKWKPRKMRCKVATRAYKLLSPIKGRRKRCPLGSRRVDKD